MFDAKAECDIVQNTKFLLALNFVDIHHKLKSCQLVFQMDTSCTIERFVDTNLVMMCIIVGVSFAPKNNY